MNRRRAIRNVAIITAGAALLPACHTADRSSLSLKHLSLTGSQEKMLAALSDTIIPSTHSFIGAKELKGHEFVLTMIDDCASPDDQNKFTRGLIAFEEVCKTKWDRSFQNCTGQQRNELLKDIEQKKDVPEPAIEFYSTVKRYTIQSFTSSKEFMTDIRKFKLAPGPNYKGCVPVAKT